jgi:YHS domain-containing protein
MKVVARVVPAVCVSALLMTTFALGQSEKGVKADAAKPAVHAKQLKPQTTCPVTGDPIDKKLYVDYKGKRIYVCCSSCIAPLKKNPEKYIKKLEKMGQGVETISENSIQESKGAKGDTSIAPEAGYWTCPMHPEIHKTEPGQCPICGMNLVYKKTAKETQKAKGAEMKGMDHGKM